MAQDSIRSDDHQCASSICDTACHMCRSCDVVLKSTDLGHAVPLISASQLSDYQCEIVAFQDAWIYVQ